MVAIYPVSGSVRHVRSLVDIDALNAGVELVYVPVRHFHKASPCTPSDEFYNLNHLLDSAYILGKL